MFRFSIGNTCDKVTTILSETMNPANAELIKKLKPVWGVGAEGETNGAWQERGDIGCAWSLAYAGKTLECADSMCIALQIKAMEEGIWSGVYEG